jgi:hypothetical protein
MVSWTTLLLAGRPNEAGSFASWHLIGALAESDYLMKASTDSAMYGNAKCYKYDRFYADWKSTHALQRSFDSCGGWREDERRTQRG